jgi:hypothetical protein
MFVVLDDSFILPLKTWKKEEEIFLALSCSASASGANQQQTSRDHSLPVTSLHHTSTLLTEREGESLPCRHPNRRSRLAATTVKPNRTTLLKQFHSIKSFPSSKLTNFKVLVVKNNL